jgi:hypothetical protein
MFILNKPRVSYAKQPREGVSGSLNRQIKNQQFRLDLRPRAHACGRASADRRARGVSDRGGERTDRAGPALGDMGADRWARGAGRVCAKRYLRSGPCDQDWMG